MCRDHLFLDVEIADKKNGADQARYENCYESNPLAQFFNTLVFEFIPVGQASEGSIGRDMFGSRIGTRGHSGGPRPPEEEEQKEQEQPSEEPSPTNPEGVQPADYEQDSKEKSTRSGPRVREVTDAALQQFVEDEELASLLAE